MMLSVHDLVSFHVALNLKDQRTFILFVFTKKNLLGVSFFLFFSNMLASQLQFYLVSGSTYLLKLDDCAPLWVQGEKGVILPNWIITRLADK